MSDNQVASMLQADDAYAGSQSFIKLQKAVEDVLGKKYLLPVHQGRAAENVICRAFIKKGDIIPTNYHFTTVLAHVLENGGKIEELLHDHALVLHSDHPFKGNMDIEKLEACIQKHGVDKIPFIFHEPDRRSAVLDEQPDGRSPRCGQIRHHAGAGCQSAR